jgi:ABC-type nitrate/sulfonate/bicarbonate transport system substrate-binding protein
MNRFIENARTLDEIQNAIEKLTQWAEAHPEYRESAVGVFEQLFKREEGAKEALAQARVMGLSAEETTQREQVYQLVLHATADFPETVEEARIALDAWASAHTNDPELVSFHQSLSSQEKLARLLKAHSAPK